MVVYVQAKSSMALITEHERQRLTILCARIIEEKNLAVFTQLLIELDALLDNLNNHQARRTGFEGENTAT